MKKIITSLFIAAICGFAQGQVPEFDKMEMLFAQKHYKKVYRKANNLLDKPEFDFSMFPTYYKSISLLQLAQNSYWLSKHPEALDEAVELFLTVKKSERSEQMFNAHMYELTWMKNDLTAWASDLKRMGNKDEFKKVQEVIAIIFEGMPNIDIPGEIKPEVVSEGVSNSTVSAKRQAIVNSAKKQIGVPYVWAGSSPDGFDCSGFTSFVMAENGEGLSRRSSEQYELSKKVKQKDVQKGDLVFFNNGSGVSHVGIVISDKGEPIVMIHASSNKGVIMTDIEKSEYWMKRIHGFGTYLD